jgi:hypothetical protein
MNIPTTQLVTPHHVSRILAWIVILLGLPGPFALTPVNALDLEEALKDVHPEIPKWATIIKVTSPDDEPQFETVHLGDSENRVDFWPASTIKLYTVIAGVEFLNEHRMPLDSVVVFSRPDENGGFVRDCARTFSEMMSEVFRRSSNEDYTLLLRMMGIDYVNTRFLIPERGFPHSALMRDYVTYRPVIYENDEPQMIELVAPDGRRTVIRHEWSGVSYAEQRGATVLSSTTGNCTSTAELANCVRRLVFHEHISPDERFHITSDQARFILNGDEARGIVGFKNRSAGAYGWEQSGEVVFPDADFYHKGGLISTYVLDVGYISHESTGNHIIFALAAHSGTEQVMRDMAKAVFESIRSQSENDQP